MRFRQRLDRLHAHPSFPAALKIIETLRHQRYAAVLAGGCVRDSLMGERPKDLDIATSAPPEAVEATFSHSLPVGKAFGTILVIEAGQNFEVTTFRRDGPYDDGRHPREVFFTDMKEDAERRDFTVNALFYDPLEREVIDFVGGLEDLQKRLLRTVGEAAARFREDHLRMLRGPRFVAQTGFDLDARAFEAIRDHASDLKSVSVERVFNETRRLLESPFVLKGLELLVSSRLAQVFWPELMSVDIRKLEAFLPFCDWENAFAAVAAITSIETIEKRLRTWKVPRESLRRVDAQTVGCKVLLNEKSSTADRVRVLGGDAFASALQLASGFLKLKGEADRISAWTEEYLRVVGRLGELPAPFVSGQDLIALGVEPGKKMGLLLKALFEAQLNGEITTRARALERARKLASSD